MKILYVEDDDYYQFLVNMEIDRHFGAKSCTVVSTMDEYIGKMKKGYNPDVILMDIMLPQKKGGDVIPDGGIRLAEDKLHGNKPLIFISMWSPEEYEERRKEIKCTGYFNKPIDFDNMIQLIQKVAGVSNESY